MSTPPVEKLRCKGCCGDGRRANHSGGEDGAHGGHSDGGCHAGAGAGRRRVWVAAWPPGRAGFGLSGASFALSGPASSSVARAKRALLVSITRGGEVRDLTPESLATS